MTEETFKKKKRELQEQYSYWAEMRNKAINELDRIVKKTHKLEKMYYGDAGEV